VQAGARPITTWVYVSELQRDWARAATAEKVTKLFAQRGGAFGQGLLWEWDLLDLKEGTRRRRSTGDRRRTIHPTRTGLHLEEELDHPMFCTSAELVYVAQFSLSSDSCLLGRGEVGSPKRFPPLQAPCGLGQPDLPCKSRCQSTQRTSLAQASSSSGAKPLYATRPSDCVFDSLFN
jgi:hypothetical protein